MCDEKNTVLGVLAHVDAGKTTLCEALLYLSGKLKKLGRAASPSSPSRRCCHWRMGS